MKFKMNLKRIVLILIIIFLIFLAYNLYNYFKPVKVIYHKGIKYEFRDDVKEAYKISVYPDEEILHKLFWNVDISNISILFKPLDPRTIGYYQVEAFELTYKLTLMYKTIPYTIARIDSQAQPVFMSRNFNAQPIETYENITRENDVLKIILVPPEIANETYVRAGGNKVFIYGKDFRDFDLATIKTILVAMDYKP